MVRLLIAVNVAREKEGGALEHLADCPNSRMQHQLADWVLLRQSEQSKIGDADKPVQRCQCTHQDHQVKVLAKGGVAALLCGRGKEIRQRVADDVKHSSKQHQIQNERVRSIENSERVQSK